jgi:hypothetical protein
MHTNLKVKTVTYAEMVALREEWLVQIGMSILVLVLATLACSVARAEDKPDKEKQHELEKRLEAQRDAAAKRNAAESVVGDNQYANLKQKERDALEKQQVKKDLADFKEKSLNNLATIKEMFMKAEEAWKKTPEKEPDFGLAAEYYSSVALATVPGSEEMVETSRARLLELEEIAKKHLQSAEEADTKADYTKEVEELQYIVKQLARAKTSDTAKRRLTNLKSKPDVGAWVELIQAEALENENKLVAALNAYNALAVNPRYENTLAVLKAKRKLDELNKNEDFQGKLKAEINVKAQKEAPLLLANAKNFVANNKPKLAIEALQQIVDSFPNTPFAEQAQKQLSELK